VSPFFRHIDVYTYTVRSGEHSTTHLAEHPTVKQCREREAAGNELVRLQNMDSAWLRRVCLETARPTEGLWKLTGAGK
jgi:hypothetical protein